MQTTIIKPPSGWFNINLRELWAYRDLTLMFVKRTFIAHYKQTVLGPAWALIQPLVTTIIFTIVFGNLAKLPTDGIPPFLFYMCGNIAWGYFSGCLNATANTFTANASIFGKVYFPRLTIPIASVLGQLISFLIQFLFFVAFLVYFSFRNHAVYCSWELSLLPIVLFHMAILALGCGVIISSLTTKYRDLTMLIAFGIQLWMYATPIVYPLAQIPAKWRTVYLLNPMVAVIEIYRDIFFRTGSITMTEYASSLVFSLIILCCGALLFSRVEKTFMDTV